jgi:hypothetical protein
MPTNRIRFLERQLVQLIHGLKILAAPVLIKREISAVWRSIRQQELLFGRGQQTIGLLHCVRFLKV